VELAQPEVYDAKYSKWAYADLPIFPMDWQYEVSAGTKKQFGILKKLMAREDVASLVCATDAGREGELIFRLVYHKAGCRKPFERLWISSMEDVAIKEGFENLRSGTEYDALYEAALCRERADWIVGINATRLFSTLYGQTLNVGRVMTPTLAMAVMREAAISAFKPELFYTVQIGLDGFTAASERFKTKAAAEAVKQSCSVAIVQKAECKEKTEKPPALYDLTSLQREANRVLGYTAQQTLDYTQNLYEKKLVTYPRTDSETCRRFEVNSRDRIKSWERIYLEEGPEGFAVERRGRSSKGRPPKRLPKEVTEDLLAEVQRLRAEVDYLKNLQALVLEDERRQHKKRW
jgi:DNA topoisomerase III